MNEKIAQLKSQYASLDKRDQRILLIGAAALILYVLIDWIFLSAYDAKENQIKRYQANSATLAWMNQAVSEIQQLKGSGAVGNRSANMTLAQIAEASAKKAGFRLTRFQPKDDTEAQVWLDKIAFSDLLSFLNQLEQVHNASIETLAVNSAGEPGLVNARLKFKK